VQHRELYHHSRREIRLISLIGYLVGAEIEMACMELEKAQLADQLENRKLMERAKCLLQRELNNRRGKGVLDAVKAKPAKAQASARNH
jgi:two-component system, response regulator PdtaR